MTVQCQSEKQNRYSHPLGKRPPELRSKLANGSKLLPMTDGRSATARRFKDLVQDMTADLGGADMLSEGEKQLIRRCATLSAESECQEALWVRGDKAFDVLTYVTMANCLRRILETIGIKRRPRDVSLADYLDAKPVENEAAE